MILHFRAVERTLTWQLFPFHIASTQGIAQAFFSLVPSFIRTCTFFRTQWQFYRHIVKLELLVNLHHQAVKGLGFRINLVFCTENVRIVLYKTTHTHQAMQSTWWLIAVARAKLSQAQRQITVWTQALIEHLHMTRAIHWFYRIVTLLRLGNEHVFFVVFPVTWFFPQDFVHHQRRADFFVASRIQLSAHVLFYHLPQCPTFRMPKCHTRGFVLHVEQIQLLAQFAVVSFFGFFDALNVFF